MELRVSKDGDLLVGQSALDAISVVAQVILLLLLFPVLIIIFIDMSVALVRLQKLAIKVINSLAFKMGLKEGEEIILNTTLVAV